MHLSCPILQRDRLGDYVLLSISIALLLELLCPGRRHLCLHPQLVYLRQGFTTLLALDRGSMLWWS